MEDNIPFHGLNAHAVGSDFVIEDADYSEEQKRFEEVINESENPFAIQSLEEAIRTLRVDSPELPDEVNRATYEFIEVLKISLTRGTPAEKENSIKEILLQILSNVKRPQYWDNLNMILELTCVKKLRQNHSRKLIRDIQLGKKYADIAEFIKKHISEDVLTMELQEKREYFKGKYETLADCEIENWDWSTCIEEAINKKPIKQDGIMTLLAENAEFFIKKTLLVNDCNCNIQKLCGQIKDYSKINDIIQFTLMNGEKILIRLKESPMKNIEISKRSIKGLLNYLRSPDFAIDNRVNVNENKFITGGEFQVERHEREEIENNDTNKRRFRRELENSQVFLTIFDLKNPEFPLYKIEVYENKQGVFLVSLIKYVTEVRFEILNNFSLIADFDKDIKVQIDSAEIFEVHDKDMNRSIRVIDVDDSTERNLKFYTEIQSEICKLRYALEQNPQLLRSLLLNLIQNRLESINLEEFKSELSEAPGKIYQRLTKLIEKCRDNLEIDTSLELELKKIALSAIYEKIVLKDKSIDVERVMEMMSESEANTIKVIGKNLILFIGITGAGKSSTVALLLGAIMKEFENKYGETAVNVEKNSENYPKIGHLLGTSMTIYAKAFELEPNYRKDGLRECLLADCPGTLDTRGTEYELCTHMSIDRTLKSAANIKSIAVVIPYASFLNGRGQMILSTFEAVIDILPGFLEDNEVWKSIFILITKHSGQGNYLEILLNRTAQHLEEAKSSLETEKTHSQYITETMLLFERRVIIWDRINKIIQNDQISKITIGNKNLKSEILNKKFKNSTPIPKEMFGEWSFSRDLLAQFEKVIEISTNTWTSILLPKYLEEIPKRIDEVCKEIKEKEIGDKSSLKTIEDYKDQIASMEEESKRIDNELTEIETRIECPDFNNETFSSANQEILNSHIEYVRHLESQSLKAIESEKQLEMLLLEYSRVCNEKMQSKQFIEHEIKKLSEGSNHHTLYELKYYPDDRIRIKILNEGARDIARDQVRNFRHTDFQNPNPPTSEIRIRDFKGETINHVYLEAEYKLVPQNSPEILNRFSRGEKMFSYRAIIEGNGFKIDGVPCSSEDGKRMVWPIKTYFTGNPENLPHFKITHEIPNCVINEATLINRNAEWTKISNEISTAMMRIRMLQQQISSAKRQSEQSKNEYLQACANLEAAKKESYLIGIQSLIQVKRDLKSLCGNKIKDFEKLYQNELKKRNMMEENQIENRIKLEELKNEKKILALVIHSHFESAKHLYSFCRNILESGNAYRDEAKNECSRFKSMFDGEKENLIAKLNEDLGLN